jgi:hypothetical protein
MRSRSSRLPQPVLFNAKKHKKLSRWQRIKKDTEGVVGVLTLVGIATAYVLVHYWIPLG